MAAFNKDNIDLKDTEHVICNCPVCQKEIDIHYKGQLNISIFCSDCGCPVRVRIADEQLPNQTHT